MMQTETRYIRPAAERDAGRIAEIIVTNYRTNFYPFFRNDAYYFDELNVLDMVKEYAQSSEGLRNSAVYDDGIVKGVIRISGTEIEKLYVEPQFQSQGIGAVLLQSDVLTGTAQSETEEIDTTFSIWAKGQTEVTEPETDATVPVAVYVFIPVCLLVFIFLLSLVLVNRNLKTEPILLLSGKGE